MERVSKALIAFALVAGSFVANAELLDRGGGMIYDTVLDVTWLQDANYAQTSGYDADGRMTWDEANAWVGSLVYGGFHDWRLPTVSPKNGMYFVYGDRIDQPSNSYSGLTDAGFNVAGPYSELGYMFYTNLANKGFYSTSGVIQWDWDNVNSGPFTNLQHYFYWTGTEYIHAPENFPTTPNYCAPPTYCAWDFVIGYGDQTIYDKSMRFYAWAVRDGDSTPGALLIQLHTDTIGVGPGKSLQKQVELAQTYYAAGDVAATCAVLTDFVSTVRGYVTGKKPKLSAEVASHLVADAQATMTAIGCN